MKTEIQKKEREESESRAFDEGRRETRQEAGWRVTCKVFVSCFIWMNETLSVTKMT